MHAFPVPKVIRRFAQRFNDAGFSLYIVGGAIRDHLLGLESEDYDFTTDALPSEVIALFHRVIPTGIEHGTVTVHFEGESFEVTTFRSEGDYLDARHPSSVTFIRNLEEDLKRRDFTINAFAADCATGLIIDLNDGFSDLKKKSIRAIGEPKKRFEEDALRMMRACRIAAKLGFLIERETFAAIKAMSANLANISVERIREELYKLINSDHPRLGLEYLGESGILKVILPELEANRGLWQGGMHHEDVLEHTISSVQAAADLHFSLEVRLAALLHDIGKYKTAKPTEERNTFHSHETEGEKMAISILRRFKASNDQTKLVSHLVRHHMFSYQDNWTNSAVRRFIRSVGVEELKPLFALRVADQMAIHGKADLTVLTELEKRIDGILDAKDALGIKDLAINGNNLMSIGIPKGEMIGKTLQYLLETVLDDPAQNDEQTLLNLAKNYQSLLGSTTSS